MHTWERNSNTEGDFPINGHMKIMTELKAYLADVNARVIIIKQEVNAADVDGHMTIMRELEVNITGMAALDEC